ncbi:MAG TPA: MlaD family protein [Candidatus Binatus sp.]|nr:MlaD family protein [Candidatus Binatus sp.]
MLLLTLAGCASQTPSYYTTQLDTSGGLGPGDPITHASATIGHVTGVTPIGDGDSEIAFEVNGSHASEIHYDSIMTLNSLGPTPSLDVLNVDAMSHSAPSGTRLDGASSMNETQMFITARGPGSFAQALGNFAGPTTSTPPSQSAVQMTQMMAQISQQTLASAVAIAPPTQEQLDQAKREAQGVERQLMRNGKIEQAERLRSSMGSMMGGVTAPVNPTALPPTSPNP